MEELGPVDTAYNMPALPCIQALKPPSNSSGLSHSDGVK